MYIIVGGAGEVGYHVARALRDEGHDVAVVESDPARLDRVRELDVLAIEGNFAQRSLLEEQANVEHADVVIACTGNDEVNLVGCSIGKTHGARTIARLNRIEYLNEPYTESYKDMGVDIAVSPEMVAAIRVRRLLNQPSLSVKDSFISGKVFVVEGRIHSDAFVVGKRVGDVEPPAGCTLFCIYRGDQVITPHPNTIFHTNDRLMLALVNEDIAEQIPDYIGTPNVRPVNLEANADIRRVMISGATRIGIQLARLLEQSRRDVVLLEPDADRARWAGEQLEKTLVVHGDPKERTILVQENVDTFDAFVAASKSEELNVLSALMAKDLGIPMAVAVVHQPELKQFLEGRGIDLAVAPRLNTVGAVLRHVDPVTADMELQSVGNERLITFRVTKESDVAGRHLKRINFPSHTIIAAIVRGDDVILPRGNDTVEVGDMVLAFSVSGSVQALERLFR